MVRLLHFCIYSYNKLILFRVFHFLVYFMNYYYYYSDLFNLHFGIIHSLNSDIDWFSLHIIFNCYIVYTIINKRDVVFYMILLGSLLIMGIY